MISSAAYNRWPSNVEPFCIMEEGIGVELGDFKHRLAALARCLDHLIFASIIIASKDDQYR